jgi:hypothetical protein
MFSRYQSHVNCKSRNLKGNLTDNVTYFYCCHFPDPKFIYLPLRVEGWHSQGRGDGCLSTSKITLELTTGNIVITEVDALMYVVISKAENHVPYGELAGTTECMTL